MSIDTCYSNVNERAKTLIEVLERCLLACAIMFAK